MSQSRQHSKPGPEPIPSGELLEDKRAYLLWYSFLLLARKSKDPVVQSAVLEDNEEFYRPWDADKGLDPEEWWESHSHLFRERFVVRRLEHGELPQDPEAMVVEIPLRNSARPLAREVEKVILATLTERGLRSAKSVKNPSARYFL